MISQKTFEICKNKRLSVLTTHLKFGCAYFAQHRFCTKTILLNYVTRRRICFQFHMIVQLPFLEEKNRIMTPATKKSLSLLSN